MHFIIRLAIEDENGIKTEDVIQINREFNNKNTIGISLSESKQILKNLQSNGEVAISATSLLSEIDFPTKDFGYLYSLRWGVETFFSKLKGRLALENFTGKSVESIYQDFWPTIFISNLETIMIEDIEEKVNLKKFSEKNQQKINKAVSFNSIKKMAFEIFADETNQEKVMDRFTQLFIMNPVTVREKRKVPRKKISDTQSLNFQKRKRKHVF